MIAFSNKRKTMSIYVLAITAIFLLNGCSAKPMTETMPPSENGATAIAGSPATPDSMYVCDPIYTAVAGHDGNGITNHYIYTYSNGGTKDAAPEDCLLMVKGTFMDDRVIIKKDRALVPIRAISEAFGADVLWDEKTRTVSISMGESEITLRIGETEVSVNGKAFPLEVAAIVEDSVTYVPLRFVSDCLGKAVGYIPASAPVMNDYIDTVADRSFPKGLAYNPIVWLDDPDKMDLNGKSPDEILAWLKTQMEQSLMKLKANIDIVDRGYLKGTDTDGSAFQLIEKNIKNAYYIEQVGRYAMFQGPYPMLVDTETNSIYVYTTAHLLGFITKADMTSPDTFLPLYLTN